MRSKIWTGIMVGFVISSLLISFGCATQKPVTQPTVYTEPTQTQEDIQAQEEAARKAAEEQARIAEQDLAAQKAAEAKAAMEKFVNEDVHFDFDSALLSMQAQAILRAKALYLKENAGTVTIEGHCDERGTNEYNLALGDRRARSAKSFLVDLGISSSRIKTISYGEERPLDSGSNENAWAKNRRAHFRLQ